MPKPPPLEHDIPQNLAPRILAIAWIAMLASAGIAAAQEQAADKKKHGHADTRMPFVHRIFLLDEQGNAIKTKDPGARPYSPRMTCGKCHDVDEISHGWHFNYVAGSMPAGRPGEPWLLQDPTTKTILPLSYRGWKGTFDPRSLGISDWSFVRTFGTHIPGGGVGMNPTTQPVDRAAHWTQSGKLEIDCMICHTAGNNYDVTDRELQLRTQNFRYAPLRAYGLGVVRGSIQQVFEDAEAEGTAADIKGEQWQRVTYDPSQVTSDERVHFDVVASPPPSACYYCHTTLEGGPNPPAKFHSDEDVHIAAGLRCADCHRNGIEHHTVRGYEGEANDRKDMSVSSLTCAGCHLGAGQADVTESKLGGRLGSPRPMHEGFPPIHFEKLSCTACHSGPWPEKQTRQFQTSMAHKLGIESFTRTRNDQPHIAGPVFLYGHDGKITPHKMVWPNYWGRMTGESITPLPVAQVTAAGRGILPNRREGQPEAWAPLTDEQIAKVLEKLAAAPAAPATTQSAPPAEPVYVSGGRIHRRASDGEITPQLHPSAEPYAWPMAHDVRPASQSLGIRGCADCHSEDAPIYFGDVATLGPLPDNAKVVNAMHRFRAQDDMTIARTFAATFAFRNLLKIAAFASAAVIAGVLLLYFLRSLSYLSTRGRP